MRRPITRIGIALAAFIAAIVAAAGLPGCQQLFTSSLAKPLARSTVTLPDTLTTEQAADKAAEAKANNDTALAEALVDKLVDQVTDPAAQPELAAAAASAAVTASGASDAVMEAVDEALASGNMDEIDAAALLADIQAGINPDVLEALNYLDPDTGIADPAALTDTELSSTDYLIAAIIIAASAIPEGSDPTDPDVQSDLTGTPEAEVATDLLQQARELVEPGSSAEDLLNEFSSMFGV